MTAKIIADSISPHGKRIRSIEMRMPRIILAEFNTHREISKNTRSSRAVPIEKIIEEVQLNPFIPEHWGAAQRGMQAYAETNAPVAIELDYDQMITLDRERAWLFARDRAVEVAHGFHAAGYAKQIVNRLLEPWMFVDTLATSTGWANFLALRDHHAAEPHIQKLAREVKQAMSESTPVTLSPGEWHIPYVERGSDDAMQIVAEAARLGVPSYELAVKVSVARSARISYAPFDGNGSIEKELERYELLVGSAPIHASPAEHQATPDEIGCDGKWKYPDRHGNLKGWIQHRKTIPFEYVAEAE